MIKTSSSLLLGIVATSIIMAAGLALSQQTTTKNLGSPLIIADLSDGAGPAAVPYPSGRNNDFSTNFKLAVTGYIQSSFSSSNVLGVTISDPRYVDTQGNFLTAINGLQTTLSASYSTNNPPPFVIVADPSATITYQVVTALQQSLPAATPIFVTASTADTGKLDGDDDDDSDNVGNVFRISGSDSNGVAANIVDVLYKLQQTTLCIAVTDDVGGNSFAQAVERDLRRRPKGYPVLLKTVKVQSNPNSRMTDGLALSQSDDAAMVELVRDPDQCRAVLVGGEGDIAARLLSARKRASPTIQPALGRAFFFFAPSAAAPRFPVPASEAAILPMQGVFTATEWKSLDTVADRVGSGVLTDLDSINDGFAFFVGPVLDSISLAAVAASKSSSSSSAISFAAIRSQTLTSGFTTPFRIGGGIMNTRAPSECRVHLVRLGVAGGSSPSSILAEWTGATNNNVIVTSAGNSLVPVQASEPFVVCLLGQQSCPTLSELNHAYFTLLSSAPSVLPPSVSVVVKAISAGTLGITTIDKISQEANTCDFVIGPGSSTTARDLFPFFNFYGVPMVDFSSSDTSLSNQISFSTYTRVNPTDEYVARVAGGTFHNFGWESIAIVTTLDTYGAEIVSSYTAGLAQARVSVEASLMIPVSKLNNDTIYRTLEKVKTELITRIIVLAISSTDEVHSIFFRNIVDLDMTGTQIFWLSDSMCQYAAINPSARAKLQNSFCAAPKYDVNAYRQQYASLFQADLPMSKQLFQKGGFDVSQCDLRSSDMYAPFASDAALTVLHTIKRISDGAGGQTARIIAAQHNLSLLMSLIHSTHVSGITGIIAFDPVSGERTNAAYSVDIQQPKGQVVKFAYWNSGTGFFLEDLPTPLIWFNNGTEIPKYTTRDMRFIITTTVKRNTASVILSIVGFIVTVSIFVFCYKHYKLKKMVAGVEEQQHQSQQQNQQQPQGGDNFQQTPGQYPGPGQGVSVEMRAQ